MSPNRIHRTDMSNRRNRNSSRDSIRNYERAAPYSPATAMTNPELQTTGTNQASWIRSYSGPVGFLVLVGCVGLFYFFFQETLTLDNLASHEATLDQWRVDWPIVSAILALSIYVAVTGLSLPGAAILSLVIGWYFGFWKAMVIVSFGSTAGATLAFLLSRFLLRDWVQNTFGKRLATVQESFDREGAYYLFSLRLIPAFPFFVVNLVMGLTNVRTWTYWWVSQIGMLPGTIAYVLAGSQIPSLKTVADEGVGTILRPGTIAAFCVLGIMPYAIRKVVKLLESKTDHETTAHQAD